MILAVDLANTYITVGCIDRKRIYFWERITTVIGKPNLEYAITLKSILEIYHIDLAQIEGAIVSSVVPPLNRTISEAIRKITGIRAQFVGSGMKTGLNIRMDNPRSVGSDMIATAVGALEKHKPPLIIIDMSTAVSFSVIDRNSNYIGGCLMPGLRISLDALSSHTAQLPKVSLETPSHVIGKNTVNSMQSGIIYGYAAMFDGMIDRIEGELGEKATIVATGGLMKLLLPLLSHKVLFDETLILKGLLALYEKNRIIPGKFRRPGGSGTE